MVGVINNNGVFRSQLRLQETELPGLVPHVLWSVAGSSPGLLLRLAGRHHRGRLALSYLLFVPAPGLFSVCYLSRAVVVAQV